MIILQQGKSEPDFYGVLVYKKKKKKNRELISDQFKKIIICYKYIRYNINVMRQSACLMHNPIKVNSFASLIN